MKLITNNKCEICGRELTDEASIARKMGDDCWNNYNKGIQAAGTSQKQIERLENVDDKLARNWTLLAKQAMGQMKTELAKTMLGRAERRAALIGVPKLKPEILIQYVPRGTYDFKPPRYNQDFLDQFKKRIGERFRFWNKIKDCWQVKPVDDGMLKLIADLLTKHFPDHVVRIEREAAQIAV